jgi:hyperosmotically inducible protein
MRALLTLAVVASLLAASAAAQERATPDPPGPPPVPTPSEPGVGKRIGESVDRGLNTLGQKLRKTWADVRQSIDELTVQGRVYGRLRWDKALEKAPIEISVQNESTVVLSGSVADESAHTTAVQLAQGTIGVGKVVDNLTVSSTTIKTVPPITDPATPVVPPAVPK